MSAPHLYFDFLRENSLIVDVKSVRDFGVNDPSNKISFEGASLIVGGGGLLDCEYFAPELELITKLRHAKLKVLWGAGFNKYNLNYYSDIFNPSRENLSGFDLVGVRDYSSGFDWVPCASCMHEVFQAPGGEPLNEFVTLLHSDRSLISGSEALPNPLDNNNSFEKIIAHIKSGNTVLTNSYHGAYWAQLLGKKVICFPTTSKMLNFKYPIPICSPVEWRRYLKFGYIAEEALQDSIDANRRFAQKVGERLSSKSSSTNSFISLPSLDVQRRNLDCHVGLARVSGKTIAEEVQSKVLSRLACPETHGPLDLIRIEVANNAVRSGFLVSRHLDRIVGSIKNFQIDFVRHDEPLLSDELLQAVKDGVLPYRSDFAPVWSLTRYDDESVSYFGNRGELNSEDMCYISGCGASISFEAKGLVEILLFSHPWSGVVEIAYCGNKIVQDLYAPHTTIPTPKFVDVGSETCTVTITISLSKNPLSFDGQCLFAGYKTQTSEVSPLIYTRDSKVRGSDFNDKFHELLASVPANGLLLDLGGGNRQVLDSRYLNLDYAAYAEPDIIGDAMCLPFKSGSFDAVYSSGVFEHIQNPLQAAKEVSRVLKAGGRALVCWSFMQPIHSEGQHFFNATPWGVIYAFKDLKPKNIFYDTSLNFLVDWALSVSKIRSFIPTEEIESVLSRLEDWDKLIPEDRKSYMANGVWVEFVKN
ncbi:MAG: methyltransferase domain-containing protein [Pseudomonadota bacterium]